jgi:hypothetical protein
LDLNEVELALISFARTNKHVFQLTGGSHKEIRGWHTMYANNVQHVNRIINYLEQEQQQQQQQVDEEEEENDAMDYFDDNDDADDVEEVYNEFTDSGTQYAEVDNIADNISKSPRIAVILTGPFTQKQYDLAKTKTQVSHYKLRVALNWLKNNNVLYRDVKFDDICATPQVIQCHRIEGSSGSNIEDIYDITAVFPDCNEPLEINGGCNTANEFKQTTLDKMITEDSEKTTTIPARCSSTVLKDYTDTNSLKAFPLQFPYGIGNLDWEGEQRSGQLYLQYLLTLSSPNFHIAEFVVVIHNMYERKRMVDRSYMSVSDEQKQTIGELEEDDMHAAIQRYLGGKSGTNPADMFLRKLTAITGSMAHTEQAAKKARKNMFSMITKFGLPSVLFTITPEDKMNFRVKIMSHGVNGCKDPPSTTENDSTIKEFVIDCANIRTEYPGLCAFDFENILAITIEHLIGWDRKKQHNIKGKGIFGDIVAWTCAIEEQGRNTLHAHFLLWIENWDEILEGLGDITK